MRNTILSFIILMIFSISAYSQQFSITAGPGIPINFTNNSALKGKSSGFLILERESIIHKSWHFRAGLGVNWYKLKIDNHTANSATYFSVPITIIKYWNDFGKTKPFIEVGNALLLGTDSQTYTDSTYRNLPMTEPFIVTMSLGAGIRHEFNDNFFIGLKANYVQQLNPMVLGYYDLGTRFNGVQLGLTIGGKFKMDK